MTLSRVIFTRGDVAVSSSLDPKWDATVERLDTLDYSSLGFDPFTDYPTDSNGNPLREITIYEIGSNDQTVGENHTVPFGSRGFDSFISDNQFLPGIDRIGISTSKPIFGDRHEDVLVRAMVHEMLHESNIIRQRSVVGLNRILEHVENPDDFRLEKIYSAVEHVVLRTAMDRFAEANELQYASATKSAGAYARALKRELRDAGVPEVDGNPADIVLAEQSAVGGEGVDGEYVIPVLLNSLEGIAVYVNEESDIVTTNPGSRYTQSMLDHYGRETRDEGGNVTAGMTLGGHFRALADAFGIDGEVGIQGSYANDREGSDKPASDAAKPVIIDLDGDGVEINADSQVSFDWDNDGYLESGNWAAADDGFLVIDLEADGAIGTNGGDGVIDQGREIAFSQWSPNEEMTDLQALAEAIDADGNLIFDTNGDGVLDTNDDVWSSMKIFQDLDQNGEVDDGELRTLDDWGISQINLSYDDGSSFSEYEDDIVALGNILHGMASYVRDGDLIEGGVGDISLLYTTQGWRYVETASGYQIEFEDGDETMVFWDAEGQADADADLTSDNLAGAYGDDRDNVLDATGAAQDLVITGGAGDDNILGGDANDMLSGGQGADTIHAGAGHDVVLADSLDDISGGAITGGGGYDRLIVSEEATLNIADLSALGFEAVVAGSGDDVIAALDDEQSYNISGNGGSDTLTTAGGADVLSGGEGDDRLGAGAGADRLFGGSGNDLLEAGDDADFLAGGAGDDALLGGGGNDQYYYQRGDGHDNILDVATGTVIDRVEYEEVVEYHTGSGKSANTNYVNELRTGLIESAGQIDGGIDTLEFGYGINVEDVLFTIDGDNAVVELRNTDDSDTGADESDTVSGDGSITIQDWSNEKSRIENFAFATGITLDMSQIESGQTGHGAVDDLVGTQDGDWINSGGADDTVQGGDGKDILIGGDGDDWISGGDDNYKNDRYSKDFIFGGDGDDRIYSRGGDDIVSGGAGDDYISGSYGNDLIFGDEGDDELRGYGDNDTLIGGAGDDRLLGGWGDDLYIYFRGDGKDTIFDDYRDIEDGEVVIEIGETGSHFLDTLVSSNWISSTRTVQQMYNGWDVLQYGYSVKIEDVFFDLQGDDLVMGIRELDGDGNALSLDQMGDVVTVEDWGDKRSRVEELRFGDGLAINISEFGSFQSGYADDNALTGTGQGDLLNGGDGNDTLLGEGGDDVLVGGGGNDNIAGGSGSDDIFGNDGDDTLGGGAGRDFIQGGVGDDVIEGGADNDVMTGGSGDDTLRGGLGDDIYIFNRGDGHDVIDESIFTINEANNVAETIVGASDDLAIGDGFKGGNMWINETRTGAIVTPEEGGSDALQFGVYIDIADLTVNTTSTDLDSDLIVQLHPAVEGGDIEDSVTIENWGTQQFRIETFRFANGFSLDVSEITFAYTGDDDDNTILAGTNQMYGAPVPVASWLAGGAGNDELFGANFADIIVGGTGDDRLEGGDGNDTYVFGRGDGMDTIFDTGSTAVGSDSGNLGGDKLLFGAGITVEDLILNRDGDNMNIYVANQNDMTVPLMELNDFITIEDWDTPGNRIELLQFFNGLDFDVSEIEQTFLGKEVESDFVLTMGERYIENHGNHFLGETNSTGEIKAAFDGIDTDLYLSFRAYDVDSDGEIEVFLNGESIEAISAGDNNDYVDVEIPIPAGSQLSGGNVLTFSQTGAIHYKWGVTDILLEPIEPAVMGSDTDFILTLNETDTGNYGNHFHGAYAPDGSVAASFSGTDEDLLLKFDAYDVDFDGEIEVSVNGESVGEVGIGFNNGERVVEFEVSSDMQVAGENIIEFSETGDANWKWGVTDITLERAKIASINDNLNGSNSADWMDGFGGNDILTALNGDDFIFGRDGDDTLNGGSGDDIMAGGDNDDLLYGGAGADVMTGGADDDTLEGGAGNDVLMGGTGDDILNGGSGNDLLVGDFGDDTIIASAGEDQIRFGYGDGNDTYQGNASYNATDVFIFENNIQAKDVWFERIDNDLILRLHGADDTYTFESWYYGTNANAGVQGFSADGEWLDAGQVNSLVTAMANDIVNLNDGTTASGILLGETPDDVLTAIDAAWV